MSAPTTTSQTGPQSGTPNTKGLSEGIDEHLFGAAFDGRIVGRFLERLAPYKKRICWALCAVIAYTLTQISIPLMIRAVIDQTVAADGIGGSANRVGGGADRTLRNLLRLRDNGGWASHLRLRRWRW